MKHARKSHRQSRKRIKSRAQCAHLSFQTPHRPRTRTPAPRTRVRTTLPRIVPQALTSSRRAISHIASIAKPPSTRRPHPSHHRRHHRVNTHRIHSSRVARHRVVDRVTIRARHPSPVPRVWTPKDLEWATLAWRRIHRCDAERATFTRRRRRCRAIDRDTTHPFPRSNVRRSRVEVEVGTYHRFRASKRGGRDAREGEEKRRRREERPLGGFIEF